jgi:CrcB protein
VTAVWVALAGALGACTRVVVDRLVQPPSDVHGAATRMPLGILVVNVTGSVVLGLVIGWGVSDDMRLVVGTGFCGGYTTFSTYAFDLVRLAEEGAMRTATAYFAATTVLTLAGAALGLALTGAL